jgi:hypothetical protein
MSLASVTAQQDTAASTTASQAAGTAINSLSRTSATSSTC